MTPKQEDLDPDNLVLRAADAFNARQWRLPKNSSPDHELEGSSPIINTPSPSICERCESDGCMTEREVRVYWPGQTRDMCIRHALSALNIARHMGFALDMRVLQPGAPL
jgi:hypothetical protein